MCENRNDAQLELLLHTAYIRQSGIPNHDDAWHRNSGIVICSALSAAILAPHVRHGDTMEATCCELRDSECGVTWIIHHATLIAVHAIGPSIIMHDMRVPNFTHAAPPLPPPTPPDMLTSHTHFIRHRMQANA